MTDARQTGTRAGLDRASVCVAGLWTASALLSFVMGAVAQGIAMLAGLAGLWLMSRTIAALSTAGLRAERRVDILRNDADRVDVTLTITNPTRRARHFIRFVETWGELRREFRTARLGPGETARFSYQLPTGRSGRFASRAVTAHCDFPWLLTARRRALGCVSEFTLYPRIHHFPHLAFLAAATGVHRDAGATRAAGEHDYFGVRPYVRGDNPRRIHWKVSPKAGQIMVRQYRGNAIGETLVVFFRNIEPRPENLRAPCAAAVFELGVEVCASTVHYLAAQRAPFAFVDVGRRATTIAGGSAKAREHNVMQHLAGVSAEATWVANRLPAEVCGRMRKTVRTVLVLFAGDGSARRHARQLHALGLRPTVIVVGDCERRDFPDAMSAFCVRDRAQLARLGLARTARRTPPLSLPAEPPRGTGAV